MELLLASKSPRRRQLIGSLGWPVRFVDIDCDESRCDKCPSELRAERISLLKAQAFDASTLRADEVLVTADTVVALGDRVLGKPRNDAEAAEMLRSLSNECHRVYTGVTLVWQGGQKSFTATTRVYFRALSDDEIHYYIKNYQPFDKAGAYGVQEWIGMVGISRIEGCYYNVMGLPLARLYKELTCIMPLLAL